MKILVFDNYDSFTYNIVHTVKILGYTDVAVYRNDQITLEAIDDYDKIILSPGPGLPSEAGIILDLIRTYAPTKSILGICLGMQAIAETFGGTLHNLSEVFHGVSTPVFIENEAVIFKDLPKEIEVGRYHSWVVSEENFPKALQVTAYDEQRAMMALQHREYDVRGVQFHPESILTPTGKQMIKNWLEYKHH